MHSAIDNIFRVSCYSSYGSIYGSLRSRYRYVVNHLYGDKPLDYVMDIMEQVMKDNPDISLEDMRALRVTADHCGFYPRRDQLPRLQRLGMVLSCGAGMLTRSYPFLKVYGDEKAANISPVKSALAAGVMTTLETEGTNFRQQEVRSPFTESLPEISETGGL